MKVGKVPNDVLNRIILDKLQNRRPEVLVGPKVGEDCCAIDFGGDICVMSSDPITGAEKDIGSLAVHISCNDIASCGIEPIGLLVTILMPPATTEASLEQLMGDICHTAATLHVDILGGHTEVTDAVTRFVVTTTAVGRASAGKLVSTSGAKPGDAIIMTKTAGLEGTAILAADQEERLVAMLGREQVERAKAFKQHISVIREGVLAGRHGATAMHDVTEGGILGAVWEVAHASDVGIRIYSDKIPVAEETVNICKCFGLDPLRLISSGSMLIACPDGEAMVELLEKSGIRASVIGHVTTDARKLLINAEGVVSEIEQPGADELYKVI